MQEKSRTRPAIRFPEYYLFWTFDRPEFLVEQFQTWDKLPLEFYDKGILNQDNGPDYCQALIKVGNTLLRGDIEFHLKWQDWFRHGHDQDRRYNQVILHVLWSRPRDLPLKLARRFPHFVLSDHLKMSQSRWMEIMEILKNQDVIQSLEVPKPGSTAFDPLKLAWKRFLRKSQELRDWVNQFGWEATTYMGLAKVLGYNKNSYPFVQLVKSMPPRKFMEALNPIQRSPLILWILLAWQGGLLERPFRNISHSASSYYHKLINHLKNRFSHTFTLPQQRLIHWNFSRLRPFNNPYNRLAGYSQILFQYHSSSLFNMLLDVHRKRLKLSQLLKEIQQMTCLRLSPDFKPIFQQFLGLGMLAGRSMGDQRSRLFHLNILLPLFYVWAEVNHSPGFSRYIEDIFFQFPAVDSNSKLRSMVKGMDHISLKNAYVHQALLEYYQLNFTRQQLTIQKID